MISSNCTFSLRVPVPGSVCVMAELPSGLLEACVVVGAPSDKLRDIYQVRVYTEYTQTQKTKSKKPVCRNGGGAFAPCMHPVSTHPLFKDYQITFTSSVSQSKGKPGIFKTWAVYLHVLVCEWFVPFMEIGLVDCCDTAAMYSFGRDLSSWLQKIPYYLTQRSFSSGIISVM